MEAMLGAGGGQATHAVPQYIGSRSDAQIGPHGCVPALQVNLHMPLSQVAEAEGRLHGFSQPPQCKIDVDVSTHAPVHSVVPAGHALTQAARPLVTAQRGVGAWHVVVQLPQWAWLLSEVSQPFAG